MTPRRDGRRFAVLEVSAEEDSDHVVSSENSFDELRRVVPTGKTMSLLPAI